MATLFHDMRGKITSWRKSQRDFFRRQRHGRKVRRAAASRKASSSTFIGITGSSAKTTTTALLSHILEARGSVTSQVGFNTIVTLSKTLRRPPKDRYLVAEVALDLPDTVREMSEILRPHVAVVTLIGLEHYSVFRTHEAVAAEKGALVAAVEPGGFAVLNIDDPHVAAMAGRTAERVVTYGRSDAAQYRVADVRASFPERLSLTLEWSGGRLPLATRFSAEHFWVSVAAAAATALELGVPPETVAERVATAEPPAGRLGVIEAHGGPKFLVDTVKAPWHSLPLAYKALADADAPRKRLVLGHMSDFPGADSKYRKAYLAAREIADQVIFVGDHAHRAKAGREDVESGRFLSLRTPREVADHIRDTAMPGEVILLKGSSDLHLERVAMSWQADVACWIPSCRQRLNCPACGMHALPFEIHLGRKDWRRRRLLRAALQPWKFWTQR